MTDEQAAERIDNAKNAVEAVVRVGKRAQGPRRIDPRAILPTGC